jgi:hypothetical protein
MSGSLKNHVLALLTGTSQSRVRAHQHHSAALALLVTIVPVPTMQPITVLTQWHQWKAKQLLSQVHYHQE